MEVTIRKAKIKDAEALAELTNEVDVSRFMLWQRGERQMTKARVEKIIRQFQKTGGAYFVAEANGKPVGTLTAFRGIPKKIKHQAHVAMGVRSRYRGKGVGTQLMEALISWAQENDITRIELEVMDDNEAAIALYKKFGFKKEGTKRNAIYDNGKYKSLFVMARLDRH